MSNTRKQTTVVLFYLPLSSTGNDSCRPPPRLPLVIWGCSKPAHLSSLSKRRLSRQSYQMSRYAPESGRDFVLTKPLKHQSECAMGWSACTPPWIFEVAIQGDKASYWLVGAEATGIKKPPEMYNTSRADFFFFSHSMMWMRLNKFLLLYIFDKHRQNNSSV